VRAEAIAKLARREIARDRQHRAGDSRGHRVVDKCQDVCEDPCTAYVDRAPTKRREDVGHDPRQVAAELDLRTSGRLRPRQREGDLVSVKTGPCIGRDGNDRLEQAGGRDRNLASAGAQHGNRIVNYFRIADTAISHGSTLAGSDGPGEGAISRFRLDTEVAGHTRIASMSMTDESKIHVRAPSHGRGAGYGSAAVAGSKLIRRVGLAR